SPSHSPSDFKGCWTPASPQTRPDSPPPCGEGLGVGGSPDLSVLHSPHPFPPPQGGEGTLRRAPRLTSSHDLVCRPSMPVGAHFAGVLISVDRVFASGSDSSTALVYISDGAGLRARSPPLASNSTEDFHLASVIWPNRSA